MSFRRPEQDRGSSSLGYRISSNRQPGVEIANNRMPSRPMTRQFNPEDLPYPIPKQMEPFRPPPARDMSPPMPMPTPMIPRERQGIEQLMRPKSFTNLDMLGRPDLAFKYSHMEPGREESFFGSPVDTSIRGTYRRTRDARLKNKLYDEYGYLEGAPRQRTTFSEGFIGPNSFNEMYGGAYDDAIFRIVDPYTNRIEQFPMASRGIEGLLMSEADSYSPQNLIQMLQDARDAGNEDEADMLYNDLEMRFPTLADVDDDNAAAQSLFGQGYSMEEIMDIMAARPMSA